MKTSTIVVICVTTFLLGLFAGVAAGLSKIKQLESAVTSLLEMRQIDAPHDVAIRLKTIAAAQDGDTSWIVRSNCFRIRSQIPLIDPSIFAGAKRTDVAALIGRATNKVVELERNNLCSLSN